MGRGVRPLDVPQPMLGHMLKSHVPGNLGHQLESRVLHADTESEAANTGHYVGAIHVKLHRWLFNNVIANRVQLGGGQQWLIPLLLRVILRNDHDVVLVNAATASSPSWLVIFPSRSPFATWLIRQDINTFPIVDFLLLTVFIRGQRFMGIKESRVRIRLAVSGPGRFLGRHLVMMVVIAPLPLVFWTFRSALLFNLSSKNPNMIGYIEFWQNNVCTTCWTRVGGWKTFHKMPISSCNLRTPTSPPQGKVKCSAVDTRDVSHSITKVSAASETCAMWLAKTPCDNRIESVRTPGWPTYHLPFPSLFVLISMWGALGWGSLTAVLSGFRLMWLLVQAVNVTRKSTWEKRWKAISNSSYIATDVNVSSSVAWLTSGAQEQEGVIVWMGHLRCGNLNLCTVISRTVNTTIYIFND